ncbi:class I SAM-dependent methyltransferase [Leifsonia soli]|uniref:SAM-dependent methyltransferase n=1 Tax=Leifsonia soli TaxID=582665 RepID=A0A852T2R2_9MICO|nr:methyltransferase domain-containing protein [Leifsonia soli]NYD74964.1 SAM-dependent methyltransferase [Leifsonia soli]
MNAGRISSVLLRAEHVGTGPSAEFGRGGAEPYELAIRAGRGLLALVARDGSIEDAVPLDVSAYLAAATDGERDVLGLTVGPVLDIGCGPARLVRAAIESGRIALGIDVSPAAIQHARSAGLPVLHRSVFDPLPAEGTWGAVALFDGNVGIGGDPIALLTRGSELLRPGGRMIVETHTDPERDAVFLAQLVHPAGARSAWFPWAEVGARVASEIAGDLGMEATTVTVAGRTFVLATR